MIFNCFKLAHFINVDFYNKHALLTDHMCRTPIKKKQKKHLGVPVSSLYPTHGKCLFTMSSCTHVGLTHAYVMKTSMISITHM